MLHVILYMYICTYMTYNEQEDTEVLGALVRVHTLINGIHSVIMNSHVVAYSALACRNNLACLHGWVTLTNVVGMGMHIVRRCFLHEHVKEFQYYSMLFREVLVQFPSRLSLSKKKNKKKRPSYVMYGTLECSSQCLFRYLP